MEQWSQKLLLGFSLVVSDQALALIQDMTIFVAQERYQQGSTALTDPRGLDHPPRVGRRSAQGGPDGLGDFESFALAKLSRQRGQPSRFFGLDRQL